MILLYRARLCLVAAVLAAALIIALELPVSELVHQQGQLGTTSRELSTVEARNAALHADVSALREDSAVAAIAHEEYGLVDPGEASYVILPRRGAARAAGALSTTSSIPAADLVAGPGNETTPESGRIVAARPGLVRRVLNRLEFWRWAL